MKFPLMLFGCAAALGVAVAHAQADQDLEPRVQTSTVLPASPVRPASPAQTAPAGNAPAPPAHPDAAAQTGSPPPSARVRRDGADAASGARRASSARTPADVPSADRLELGTTEISGNRELPKLMYIVPWQRPNIGPFAGRPPNSLVDEALTPVDRAVFERQNHYYAALQSGTGAATTSAASVAAGQTARSAQRASGPAAGRDER